MIKVIINVRESKYRDLFDDPWAHVTAMARLPNGERRNARVFSDEEKTEFGERKGRLMFPGDFDGPKGSMDLKPGDKVELCAGEEVIVTCYVVNE
jgi:hypothetical protein